MARSMRFRLVSVLAIHATLTQCISVESRSQRSAQYDQAYLDTSQAAPLVETKAVAFHVASMFYHPAVLPFEGFVKRLARGDFKTAFKRLDWRYIPSNIDNALIEDLLDAGYLPALVKVTNTGTVPASMQTLVLKSSLGGGMGTAIPNEELPTVFKSFNWKQLSADAANVAIVLTVIAAALTAPYLISLSSKNNPSPGTQLALELMPNIILGNSGGAVGFGVGAMCENGVPQSYDERPLTDAEGRTLTAACWKESMAVTVPISMSHNQDISSGSLKKIVDLDYNSSLLPYRVLQPGESVVGLQFFAMPNGIVDWQGPAIGADVVAHAATADVSQLGHSEGTFVSAGFFKGERGAKLALAKMPVATCGYASDSGRFFMTFKDNYSDEFVVQRLEVTLDTKTLPAAGSDFTLDPNNSNQRAILTLGRGLGPLSGEWKSFNLASHCRLHFENSQSTAGTGRTLVGGNGTMQFFDEFQLKSRLSCERLAAWDSHRTENWLKLSADLTCRGRHAPGKNIKTARRALEWPRSPQQPI